MVQIHRKGTFAQMLNSNDTGALAYTHVDCGLFRPTSAITEPDDSVTVIYTLMLVAFGGVICGNARC
jgi:hypothetical protein